MDKKQLLVWIDLEMTGLEPQTDHILEIASLITDGDLKIIAEGPEIIIHQPEEIMQGMNEWCVKQHGESGLTEKVKSSTISLEEAEKQTLKFIKKHTGRTKVPLCGNSIGQDRMFLLKYMPKITNHLHYRMVDVSSIKELGVRWYPNMEKFYKKATHRAMDDIRESVAELKYYREKLFLDKLADEN
ncbi:MAG: oligoribonuclease [Lentisphaerales bacterium]|nr:oligoribonuclease [Lentisphaerales bacterium]